RQCECETNRSTGRRCRWSVFQQQSSDQSDAEKADNFNRHVGSGVIGRKAIPVPVGNVRGDCRKNSGDENETDPAAETFNPSLRKKENNKDGFEKFSRKLDAQQLAKCKLSGWMIKQHS